MFSELDEVLSAADRMKRAKIFARSAGKRMASRLRNAGKLASKEKLMQRAQSTAIRKLKTKLLKKDPSEASPGELAKVEKKLQSPQAKMSIKKFALKLYPILKKKDAERVAKAKEKKEEYSAINEYSWKPGDEVAPPSKAERERAEKRFKAVSGISSRKAGRKEFGDRMDQTRLDKLRDE